MPTARITLCRWVLAVYGLALIVAGLPLIFALRHVVRVIRWDWYDPTGLKVLGAALAALGVGALLAARDPLRERGLVLTQMVFATLAAFGLAYRLVFARDMTPHTAWVPLALVVVTLVLLLAAYPLRKPK
jgi:hypothetical protein